MKSRLADGLQLYGPFNNIILISSGWKGDNESACVMKSCLRLKRILPPAGSNPNRKFSRTALHTLSYRCSHYMYMDLNLHSLVGFYYTKLKDAFAIENPFSLHQKIVHFGICKHSVLRSDFDPCRLVTVLCTGIYFLWVFITATLISSITFP